MSVMFSFQILLPAAPTVGAFKSPGIWTVTPMSGQLE